MKKICIGIVFAGSLAAHPAGFLSKDDERIAERNTRRYCYCSQEAYGRRLDRLSSEKDRQLVAAWLQLVLLEVGDETFKKLESSDAWKERTPQVCSMIRLLSLDTKAKLPLEVYKECYESIHPDSRILPGFSDNTQKLMHPNMLKRKIGMYAY